ncbi:MAG: DegQ family serine endoprotease [Nitrospira sp.]|nr:DegQ family serine endoprotease [Nitrospira sp.]
MSAHLKKRRIGFVIGIGLISGVVGWGGYWLNLSQASSPPTANAGGTTLTTPANGFTEVAKRVTPAVVNITTVITEKVSGLGSGQENFRDGLEEFFGQPFNPRRRGSERSWEPRGSRRGQGSGVIVSPDGVILTNNHVIDGARDVTVTLTDKREFKGKIVGVDPKSDLAVIKINAKQLPAVAWGDATKLQVGEYVLAVGNPFGLNSTVTLGIVSAVGRGHMGITQYEDFIQTDAAINPGNSGGALVNTNGELVGINTAIFSQTGGYQGVGFAVSATMAKPISESLITTGKVIRGYVGIGIQDLNQDLAMSFSVKDSKGALISDVKPDSPAAEAGLKQGDVIVEYNGVAVEDGVALQRMVTSTPIRTKVLVRVIRDGRERDVTVRVAEQPDDSKIAKVGKSEGDSAFSGIELEDLDQDTTRVLGFDGNRGVVVTNVKPGSEAEKAGLLAGDIIQEMNRRPIKSVQDFKKASSDLKTGANVLMLISRRGSALFLSVKV